MDAVLLEALWTRSKTIVGVVSRRVGKMVFVDVDSAIYPRALTYARTGWNPKVGARVELGGVEVRSSEYVDRLNFQALFARSGGRVVALMDESWIRPRFPDAFPPVEPPPPPSRPAWLDTLGRHGVIDPATVDAASFGLDPTGLIVESYDRDAGFEHGLLCYGRWVRNTDDPIVDFARIAGRPDMFRTVRLDPEDAERAVFEATIDGSTKKFSVELTNDLTSVVRKLNECLALAHAPRRIFYWTTTGAYATASVFIARTPAEIGALTADLLGATLWAP
jgi:hypothetical protein